MAPDLKSDLYTKLKVILQEKQELPKIMQTAGSWVILRSWVTGCWVGGEEPTIRFRTITLGRGGYTALPIVGKFFNKLYRDPTFKDYQYHTFPEPDDGTLSLLDVPHFKEVLKEKGPFNLWGIFRRDDNKKIERQDERLAKQKEGEAQPQANPQIRKKSNQIFGRK